ncbi:hypothetical protein, partial [Mesorhizobium sp.]|uniref:hypothetical protein n=3 Tax=Mesorhizobium sp. TaxID=1871066 RepID=UPI0025BABBA5
NLQNKTPPKIDGVRQQSEAGHRPAFLYRAINGLGWLADPVLQISCTAGASDDCDVSATVYEQPRS